MALFTAQQTMLNLSTEQRIWECTQTTDMRKSFDGLSTMVKSVMKKNPISLIMIMT